MADGVIDSLSIEIETTSSKAVSNITKLASALAKLKTASSDLGANGGDKLQAIASAIGTVGRAIDEISDSSISRVERLASALKDLKGVNFKGVSSALKAVKTDTSFKTSGSAWADTVTGMVEEANPDDVGKIDLSGLAGDLQQIGKTFASSVVPGAKEFVKLLRNAVLTAGKLAISIAKTATSLAGAGFKKLKNLFGGDGKSGVLGNFAKSFGRIAFYRIIRSMIKALTDAFKEGLENAYAFSQGIATEGHRFAEALDSMSTAGLMMKNQLGSAFIALLTAIEPVINAIIALVTRLADVISQFISAFTGGTYLRAVNFPTEWADGAKDAGKAAKEWKNQLLGFDEINRLEEPSSGRGKTGGTELDPMKMFEDAKIDERIKNFVELLKSAIKNGNWEGAGWLLGRKLSELIGGIDAAALGRKLVGVITQAFDFVIGFIEGLDFRVLGQKIEDFLKSAFDSASEWLASKDWKEIGQKMWQKFKDLIEGIDFVTLAESFFHFLGSAFGAVAGFLEGFFREAVQAIKDYFREKTEEAGGDAWEGFKKGVTDAWANVKEWCKEHVVDPFVNGVKELLGIHSPSTVFEDIGKSVVDGLKQGFDNAWSGFQASVSSLISGLISQCRNALYTVQSIISNINSLANSNATRIQADGSIYLTGFATGGFPEDGLFMANHGELVGQFSNGRTAVANNEQIVDGIRQGVFEAVVEAMSASGGNGRPVVLNINGREFMRATYNDQRAVAREHGVSLIAT